MRRAAAGELAAQARDEGLQRVVGQRLVEAGQLVGQRPLADDAARRRHQFATAPRTRAPAAPAAARRQRRRSAAPRGPAQPRPPRRRRRCPARAAPARAAGPPPRPGRRACPGSRRRRRRGRRCVPRCGRARSAPAPACGRRARGPAQRRQAAAQGGGAGVLRQVEVEQHGVERLHAPEVVGFGDRARHVDAVAGVVQAAQPSPRAARRRLRPAGCAWDRVEQVSAGQCAAVSVGSAMARWRHEHTTQAARQSRAATLPATYDRHPAARRGALPAPPPRCSAPAPHACPRRRPRARSSPPPARAADARQVLPPHATTRRGHRAQRCRPHAPTSWPPTMRRCRVLTAKAASIDLQNGIGARQPGHDKRIDKAIGVDWTWERGGKRALRTAAAAAQRPMPRRPTSTTCSVQQLLAAAQRLLRPAGRAGPHRRRSSAIERSASQLAGHAPTRRVQAGDLPAAGRRAHRDRGPARARRRASGASSTAQRAPARAGAADRRAAVPATLRPTPTGRRCGHLPRARPTCDAWSSPKAAPTCAPPRARVRAGAGRARRRACPAQKADVTVGASLDHYPGTSTRLLELRASMPLQLGLPLRRRDRPRAGAARPRPRTSSTRPARRAGSTCSCLRAARPPTRRAARPQLRRARSCRARARSPTGPSSPTAAVRCR